MTALTTNYTKKFEEYVENHLNYFANQMRNGEFIDDHVHYETCIKKAKAIVLLAKGEVCPVLGNIGCCLNPLYEGKDGAIHLSTASTAGNVNIRENGGDVVRAIEAYNDDVYWPGDVIVGYVLFEEVKTDE